MPIVVCLEFSERGKTELDELLIRGGYRDYSDAVSVAVSNQLLLQKRASEAGEFILLTAGQTNSPQQAAPTEISNFLATSPKPQLGIPQLFAFAAVRNCQIEPAPLPNDVFPKGSAVTVDRWFFGQHNKLLPVKTSCRALAALLCDRPSGIPVSEAGERVAKAAVSVGDYFRQLDEKSGAAREEALATAFPSNADGSDRSRLRYANQFVGAINGRDQLSGLLIDLKLINYVRGKQPMLLLTAPGIEFAKLANPVLDESPTTSAVGRSRFSEDELNFLAEHIKNHVPVEDFAFRTVLGALRGGANTPELLDKKLVGLARSEKKKVTDAFITTQRSGVISRLSDLNMVQRRRNGIHVKYEATARGISYLQ